MARKEEHREERLKEVARKRELLRKEEQELKNLLRTEQEPRAPSPREERMRQGVVDALTPCKPAKPTQVTLTLDNDKNNWQMFENCYYNKNYYYRFDDFARNHDDYPTRHGKKESWGWYYPDRKHDHWAYVGYFPGYEAYLYYDPFLGKFFYWSNRARAYYPVDHVPDGDYE